jgi:general secretion pathway protein G
MRHVDMRHMSYAGRSPQLLSFLLPYRRSRGFTLIELMVATALVAVLITIALPSYQHWRNRVLTRQAGQEIAVMAAAIKQSYVDARAYPDDLASAGLGGRLDPWGRAYVYYNVEANGRGGARKDRALNPINSDFDLYSLGPDRQTHVQVSNRASDDDVIRARDGAFIGTGAEFSLQ